MGGEWGEEGGAGRAKQQHEACQGELSCVRAGCIRSRAGTLILIASYALSRSGSACPGAISSLKAPLAAIAASYHAASLWYGVIARGLGFYGC